MGPDASFINQNLKAPSHPIVAIDKRLCHDRPISVMIPQDILQHPNHGAIYEVAKDEFGQHGVAKHNKVNKDKKTSHDLNHGAVHNMAQKMTGHDKHDKYGQNEIRNNEFPHGGAHSTHGNHGTRGIGQHEYGYDKNQHNGVRNAMHDAAHPTGQSEYSQTQDNYDRNQHTGVRNAIHDATHGHPSHGTHGIHNAHGTHDIGQNDYRQSEFAQIEIREGAAHHPTHGASHGTGQHMTGIGQNEYGVTQGIGHNEFGHNETQRGDNHVQTPRGIYGVADKTTGRNEYGANPGIDHNEFGHNETQHDRSHDQTPGGIYGVAEKTTGQNEYGQNERSHGVHQPTHGIGQNEYGNSEIRQDGAHQPTHGTTHARAHDAAQGIAQTITGHNKHGHNDIGHNKHGDNKNDKHEKHEMQTALGTNNTGKTGRGPLLFDLASMDLNDRDDRVLKDSNGKPIAYLTEKNRIIQRNFVITRDPEGQDAIFDVKRKHLSKSPVRADFKELASGRMCRLGASVMEEKHGITALLWLDIGDGKKEKLPVGRLHLPSGSTLDPNVARATDNHHKMTDAFRPVTKQHKDADGRLGKDYRLDIMPGVDAGLAVLVAMVTAACTDHKRRNDDIAVKHTPATAT
ncbi:hypothetical protein Poli38472_010021 [Pythium oligandrum]|uniref:Uncharacterized protein n=1 Tax=Pythium oligandrum TaxID=41045 RepID=A0A8K1C8E0_PYTOL|nr:hypothetical protein Poli38472_010021 [Pythium oligandrum]|eukprot:TMW58462.1 hypothetical protein Poli38472_010021 [Pythium oligandrum]